MAQYLDITLYKESNSLMELIFEFIKSLPPRFTNGERLIGEILELRICIYKAIQQCASKIDIIGYAIDHLEKISDLILSLDLNGEYIDTITRINNKIKSVSGQLEQF